MISSVCISFFRKFLAKDLGGMEIIKQVANLVSVQWNISVNTLFRQVNYSFVLLVAVRGLQFFSKYFTEYKFIAKIRFTAQACYRVTGSCLFWNSIKNTSI